MANISSLLNIPTTATALSNLILVTPQKDVGYQPQSAQAGNSQTLQQPPTLVFNYEGEQTVSLTSDITDHFVEDNTAIQDQIALRPEVVTTNGFIGELNDVVPKALETLKFLADKLTTVGAYLPSISTTALIAYNEAAFAYSVDANAENAAVAAWQTVTGTGGENVISSTGLATAFKNQNKQQEAFQQFYGYWRKRTLFTVQTPWAIFQNMAIQNLRAIQDAETRMITDFEISFKVIRFANTSIISNTGSNFQGRATQQASAVVDKGVSRPSGVQSLRSQLTLGN